MPGSEKKKPMKKAINRDFNKWPGTAEAKRGKKAFVQSFNDQFPVGTEVWYLRTLPNGPKVATTIRDSAFITESDHAVCFVNGIAGFVLCDHIMQRTSD